MQIPAAGREGKHGLNRNTRFSCFLRVSASPRLTHSLAWTRDRRAARRHGLNRDTPFSCFLRFSAPSMRRPARVKEEIPVLAGFSCRLVDDQREPKPPWSSLFFLLRKILTFASLLSKPPSASRPPRQPFGIRVSPSGSALLPCPVRRGRLSPRFHPHSVEPCRLGASWGPSFWWGAAISAAVSYWT